MNILKYCCSLLGISNSTMEKAPLSAQKAYELFALEGKQGNADIQSIYEKFLKEQYDNIARLASRYRYTYTVITYPDWLTKELQQSLVKDFTEQGYTVGYHDNNLIFIMDSQQVKIPETYTSSMDADVDEMIAIDKDLEADRIIDAQKSELY